MLDTDKPLQINDQTVFWLWLSGEDIEQFGGITTILCKQYAIYKHLRVAEK
jgi:hypothetical protein